jgi:SpoVK/Ycf46/Vps4 family AAA+-type ATPase
LSKALGKLKRENKKDDFEINIITRGYDGLELKQLDIKPTTLDIDLYYNDDFKPIDELIRKRLSTENDKGIILLHGLPGTGKTTYLRHLIGTLKKKVLFVSPSVAGNLVDPHFIELLIENPNAVLVIEDAENIIMDRKIDNNSSVSNLLNISDGLLSDCLNVQIICTFNNALSMVDSALLRKGRLIAKYEFGRLTATKAQSLSNHLGFDKVINRAMTLAEIANPNEIDQKPAVNVIGFRREELIMEN